MTDEPLPTPRGTEDERRSTAAEADEDPTESEGASGRGADPPPDIGDCGGRGGDCGGRDGEREPADNGAEPGAGDDGSDGSEPLEHRLERLRLWRTVVTLAVVVARLLRSL
jgi:hypothetical protein